MQNFRVHLAKVREKLRTCTLKRADHAESFQIRDVDCSRPSFMCVSRSNRPFGISFPGQGTKLRTNLPWTTSGRLNFELIISRQICTGFQVAFSLGPSEVVGEMNSENLLSRFFSFGATMSTKVPTLRIHPESARMHI